VQRSILIVALGAGLAFGFSRAAQAQATGVEKTAAEALFGEGRRLASLRADGMPTQGVDDTWPAAPFPSKLETVGFGWWGPQAPILTHYLDDIAVVATRIGCN
jgi:hypothetical protein